MNKTKIDWPGLTHTWNPITGCKHGCSYCYARKIAMRFDGHFNPTFHKKRELQPYSQKKSLTIFVGSMTDIMGNFIPKDWIENVIHVMRSTPQHKYMLLTKNPARYRDFAWPSNVMLGATITGENKNLDSYRIEYLTEAGHDNTFLSVEPLLGEIPPISPLIDLVIVGAMTGSGAIAPQKSWIKSINHKNIYFKSNIRGLL